MGHVMKVRKIKLVTLPLEPYLLNSLSLAYSGQGLFNFSISDEHDGHDVKKHHKHNDYEDDHHSYKPRKKSKLFMNTKYFWTYPGENTLLVHLLRGWMFSNGDIC